MSEILVSVNDEFSLNVGTLSWGDDEHSKSEVYIISPPRKPLFDQLVNFLNQQPEPPFMGFLSRFFAVGLTALCIRWGSYLATLMDANAPFHDKIPVGQRTEQPQDVSWIADSEMKRLNIEISYAIAQMGRLYRRDSSAYYDLLFKAYHYLPMPVKNAQPDHDLEHFLSQAYVVSSIQLYLKQHPSSLSEFAQYGMKFSEADIDTFPLQPVSPDDADRVIGNFLTQSAWRNTIVEDYHAGITNEPFLIPHQRRFSAKDERRLLKELCNNMLVVNRTIGWLYDSTPNTAHQLSKYLAPYPESATALYNSFHYPIDWSTTEYSSVVSL